MKLMKITLLKSFVLLGAFLCFGIVQAQTVSGTVSDASGPLAGASVIVKGTTNGTQTDFDGNYTLNDVDATATLVFSYIGYATKEVVVNGQTTINVNLAEDATALDEVVIIGYGQTTIKDATGSVAAVTSEDFNGGVIASPEQLIQGKTAGVQITESSGEPGAGIEVRIRGTNSIRSNNNPLFVVDGVPLAGNQNAGAADVTGGEGGASANGNPLSFLNPSDIESISILKDASATAIYGTRGANGVVIVTTKTGKAGGKGVWEFTSSLSISTPANEYDLLDRDEFLAAYDEFVNPTLSTPTPLGDLDFGADTNWQDVITRTAASQNQNLSYSKNYGSGNIRATFGYGKQFGVLENSDFERITGRVNWTQRFFDDKLTLNLQTSLSRVNEENPFVTGGGGFRGDLLGFAYVANPTTPDDPSFVSPLNVPHPSNILANYQSLNNTNRALLNGSLTYKLTPELQAKVNLGYDDSSGSRQTMINGLATGFTTGILNNGRGAINDLDVTNQLLEATLSYRKEFENSALDAVVGYSFQDFRNRGRNIQGFGFPTTNLNSMAQNLEDGANLIESTIEGSYQQYGYGLGQDQIFINRLFGENGSTTDSAAIPITDLTGIFTDTFDNTSELQSFFGRVNYSIANKYLFTATLRADGSSNFGPENRYGYFPSGAFAWQIAEEDFIGDAISTLKLRLGYGIVGNQEGLGFGNFIRRERFGGAGFNQEGILNGGNPPGLGVVAFPEPDLRWEETTTYNFGLDFGFNNDRFSGSIDVYRKETTDLLLNVTAAQPSPQPFFFLNLDAVNLNQGVELAMAYDIADSEDFSWSASFNVAYNENELQNFDGLLDAGTIFGQGLTGAFAQRFAGGRPLFSFFVRDFGGFDENGQPIGDVQTFIGEDGIPDWNAGLSTNLRYKNFDMSLYFAGQFAFSVYNNTRNAFFTAGSLRGQRNVDQQTLADIRSGESVSAAAPVSSRFLEKGDFVRLQNATLGYNVPLSGEGFLDSMRISLTGQNLFLITNYSGLDPEVATSGGNLLNQLPTASIDWTAYPRPRTYTLAFNVTF
jgi:iron complex outermembrane receptor protein